MPLSQASPNLGTLSSVTMSELQSTVALFNETISSYREHVANLISQASSKEQTLIDFDSKVFRLDEKLSEIMDMYNVMLEDLTKVTPTVGKSEAINGWTQPEIQSDVDKLLSFVDDQTLPIINRRGDGTHDAGKVYDSLDGVTPHLVKGNHFVYKTLFGMTDHFRNVTVADMTPEFLAKSTKIDGKVLVVPRLSNTIVLEVALSYIQYNLSHYKEFDNYFEGSELQNDVFPDGATTINRPKTLPKDDQDAIRRKYHGTIILTNVKEDGTDVMKIKAHIINPDLDIKSMMDHTVGPEIELVVYKDADNVYIRFENPFPYRLDFNENPDKSIVLVDMFDKKVAGTSRLMYEWYIAISDISKINASYMDWYDIYTNVDHIASKVDKITIKPGIDGYHRHIGFDPAVRPEVEILPKSSIANFYTHGLHNGINTEDFFNTNTYPVTPLVEFIINKYAPSDDVTVRGICLLDNDVYVATNHGLYRMDSKLDEVFDLLDQDVDVRHIVAAVNEAIAFLADGTVIATKDKFLTNTIRSTIFDVSSISKMRYIAWSRQNFLMLNVGGRFYVSDRYLQRPQNVEFDGLTDTDLNNVYTRLIDRKIYVLAPDNKIRVVNTDTLMEALPVEVIDLSEKMVDAGSTFTTSFKMLGTIGSRLYAFGVTDSGKRHVIKIDTDDGSYTIGEELDDVQDPDMLLMADIDDVETMTLFRTDGSIRQITTTKDDNKFLTSSGFDSLIWHDIRDMSIQSDPQVASSGPLISLSPRHGGFAVYEDGHVYKTLSAKYVLQRSLSDVKNDVVEFIEKERSARKLGVLKYEISMYAKPDTENFDDDLDLHTKFVESGIFNRPDAKFGDKYVPAGDSVYYKTYDGKLMVAGRNDNYQLGLGHNRNVYMLTEVDLGGRLVSDIVAGDRFAVAIISDGTMMAAGSNTQDDLNIRELDVTIKSWTQVPGIVGVSRVWSGTNKIAFETNKGEIRTNFFVNAQHGTNTQGEFNALPHVEDWNDRTNFNSIKSITSSNVRKVVLTLTAMYILTNDGRVLTAGSNVRSGMPTINDFENFFTDITNTDPSLDGVKDIISTDAGTIVFLMNNGQVKYIGTDPNSYNQLDDADLMMRNIELPAGQKIFQNWVIGRDGCIYGCNGPDTPQEGKLATIVKLAKDFSWTEINGWDISGTYGRSPIVYRDYIFFFANDALRSDFKRLDVVSGVVDTIDFGPTDFTNGDAVLAYDGHIYKNGRMDELLDYDINNDNHTHVALDESMNISITGAKWLAHTNGKIYAINSRKELISFDTMTRRFAIALNSVAWVDPKIVMIASDRNLAILDGSTLYRYNTQSKTVDMTFQFGSMPGFELFDDASLDIFGTIYEVDRKLYILGVRSKKSYVLSIYDDMRIDEIYRTSPITETMANRKYFVTSDGLIMCASPNGVHKIFPRGNYEDPTSIFTPDVTVMYDHMVELSDKNLMFLPGGMDTTDLYKFARVRTSGYDVVTATGPDTSTTSVLPDGTAEQLFIDKNILRIFDADKHIHAKGINGLTFRDRMITDDMVSPDTVKLDDRNLIIFDRQDGDTLSNHLLKVTLDNTGLMNVTDFEPSTTHKFIGHIVLHGSTLFGVGKNISTGDLAILAIDVSNFEAGYTVLSENVVDISAHAVVTNRLYLFGASINATIRVNMDTNVVTRVDNLIKLSPGGTYSGISHAVVSGGKIYTFPTPDGLNVNMNELNPDIGTIGSTSAKFQNDQRMVVPRSIIKVDSAGNIRMIPQISGEFTTINVEFFGISDDGNMDFVNIDDGTDLTSIEDDGDIITIIRDGRILKINLQNNAVFGGVIPTRFMDGRMIRMNPRYSIVMTQTPNSVMLSSYDTSSLDVKTLDTGEFSLEHDLSSESRGFTLHGGRASTIMKINDDDTLEIAGSNSHGQRCLGETNIQDASGFTEVPNSIITPDDVREIKMSTNSTYVLTKDNRLFHTGRFPGKTTIDELFVELPLSTPIDPLHETTMVVTDKNIFVIDVNENKLFAAGKNDHGQLGLGTVVDVTDHLEVIGPTSGVTRIVVDGMSDVIILADTTGLLWSSGDNTNYAGLLEESRNYTQFTRIDDSYDQKLQNSSNVRKIVTDGVTTFVLLASGDIHALGNNDHGQFGSHQISSGITKILTKMDTPFPMVDISYSSGTTAMIDGSGRLFMCGDNRFSLVTANVIDNVTGPKLEIGVFVDKIHMGDGFLVCINKYGRLQVHGNNPKRHLGVDQEIIYGFQEITYVPRVRNFDTNGNNTVIVTVDGEVFVCGQNHDGRILSATPSQVQPLFTRIPNLSKIVDAKVHVGVRSLDVNHDIISLGEVVGGDHNQVWTDVPVHAYKGYEKPYTKKYSDTDAVQSIQDLDASNVNSVLFGIPKTRRVTRLMDGLDDIVGVKASLTVEIPPEVSGNVKILNVRPV